MDKKLKIIIENCPQNHKCPAVNVCPVGALSQKDFEAPIIDYDKCIGCGKCSNFCPKKALVFSPSISVPIVFIIGLYIRGVNGGGTHRTDKYGTD